MALAIDASTPALWTGNTTTITSASFTPPNGSLLVICYAANDAASADVSIASISNTGTAITWTRRARKNLNASSTGGTGTNAGAEIWTGVGNGSAITVTVTGVGNGSGNEKSCYCYVLTGADTTNLANVAGASSTSGLPSVTVTSCLADSHVFASSSDWAQKGLGTAGSGQTITAEYNLAGQITTHVWRTTSPRAANGSQTMNLTAPSAQQYNIVALEVRDAGGAPPATPPELVMAPIRRL